MHRDKRLKSAGDRRALTDHIVSFARGPCPDRLTFAHVPASVLSALEDAHEMLAQPAMWLLQDSVREQAADLRRKLERLTSVPCVLRKYALCDLHEELLEHVVGFLDDLCDMTALRATCRKWAAVKSPQLHQEQVRLLKRELYVQQGDDIIASLKAAQRYQAKLGLNLRQLGWLADHAHALQPEAKADAKRTVMDVMDAERHRLDRVTIKVITILSAARLQLPVYEFRSAHRQDIHTWVDEYLSSESFRQWVDANDLAGYW